MGCTFEQLFCCSQKISTILLTCKLTVSTQSSKLDSQVANVETFEFSDVRSKNQETRSSQMCKLEKKFALIGLVDCFSFAFINVSLLFSSVTSAKTN